MPFCVQLLLKRGAMRPSSTYTVKTREFACAQRSVNLGKELFQKASPLGFMFSYSRHRLVQVLFSGPLDAKEDTVRRYSQTLRKEEPPRHA